MSTNTQLGTYKCNNDSCTSEACKKESEYLEAVEKELVQTFPAIPLLKVRSIVKMYATAIGLLFQDMAKALSVASLVYSNEKLNPPEDPSLIVKNPEVN